MIKRVLLGLLIIAGLGYLVFKGTSQPIKAKKVFNRVISYKTNTYRPYDIKYVYDVFAKASTKDFVLNDEKLDYVNKNLQSKNSLLVVCSPYFLPNKQETTELLDFVNAGNNIYLSAFTIAPVFLDTLLGIEEEPVFYNQWPPIANSKDSTSIVWAVSDSTSKVFSYPGVGVSFYNEEYFEDADTLNVWSNDTDGGYGLVNIPFGKGNVYVQMRPITMTNYFVLHKNNYEYLDLILLKLGAKNKKIIWDNFYRRHPLSRPDQDRTTPGDSYFLELIHQNPPLTWAVYTFLLGLGLFLLIHSRRIQRPVAVIPDVKNTSYEFAKALAGLYWLKQDNVKIADKIVSQLHYNLQTKYRIFPKDFSKENVLKIAQKTNKTEAEVLAIMDQLETLESNEVIDNKWLMKFYKDVYIFSKT